VTASEASGARPLERRTVSRKTAGDGKLEITKPTAETLAPLGSPFPIVVNARVGDARLVIMPCTCRGGDRPHVHSFIESDVLRSLTAGSEVDLVLDDTGHRVLVVGA
jgi:hypothetical protein